MARRLQLQHAKVQRVRGRREEKEVQRRRVIEQRLSRAEQLRRLYLDEVRRRNKDDVIKSHEVAFIHRMETGIRHKRTLDRLEDVEQRANPTMSLRAQKMEENARRLAAARDQIDNQIHYQENHTPQFHSL